MRNKSKNVWIAVFSFLCMLLFALSFVTGYTYTGAAEDENSLFIFEKEKLYVAPVAQDGETVSRVGLHFTANELADGEKALSLYFGTYGENGMENADVFTLKETALIYRPATGDGISFDCTAMSRIRDGVEMRFYYDYDKNVFEITRVEDTETIVIFSYELEIPVAQHVGVSSGTELRVYDYAFYTQDVSGVETKSVSITENKALKLDDTTTVWSANTGFGSIFNTSAINLERNQGIQISFDVEAVTIGESMSIVFTTSDDTGVSPSQNTSAKYVTWSANGWTSNDDTVTSDETLTVEELFVADKTLKFVYAPSEVRLFVYTADIGEDNFTLVQTLHGFNISRKTLHTYLQFDAQSRLTVNNYKILTLSGTNKGVTELEVTGEGALVGNVASKLSEEDGVYTLNATNSSYFYWNQQINCNATAVRICYDILSSTIANGQQCGFAFASSLSSGNELHTAAGGEYVYYLFSSAYWANGAAKASNLSPTSVTPNKVYGVGSVMIEIDPEVGMMKISRKNTGESEYTLLQTVSEMSLSGAKYFAFQFQCNGTLQIANFQVFETDDVYVEEDITASGSLLPNSRLEMTNVDGTYMLTCGDARFAYWSEKFDFNASGTYRIKFDVVSSGIENQQCGFAFGSSVKGTGKDLLYASSGGAYVFYNGDGTGLYNATSVSSTSVKASEIWAVGSVLLEINPLTDVFNIYRKETGESEYTLLQTVNGIDFSGQKYFGLQFQAGTFELQLSNVKITYMAKAYGDGYLDDAVVSATHKLSTRNLDFDSYQKEYKVSGYLCNAENMPLAVGESVSLEIKNIADVSLTSSWFGFAFGNKAPTSSSMYANLAGNYYYGWYTGNRTHVQYVQENGSYAWIRSDCFLWNPTLELPSVLRANTSLKITYWQQTAEIAVIRIALDTGNGEGYREIQRLENLRYAAGENFYFGMTTGGTTYILCDDISIYKSSVDNVLETEIAPDETAYFEDYTLTLDISDQTMGSLDFQTAIVVAGENATASVTVNDGYVFTGWTDKDGNVLSLSTVYQFEMPYKDYALKANVEKGYKVCVLTKNGATENTYYFRAGENVLLYDVSNYKDLKLTDWTVQGAEAMVGEDLSVAFVMPEADVVVTAVYVSESTDASTDTIRDIPGRKELLALVGIAVGGVVLIGGGIVLYYIKKRRNG